MTDTAPSLSSLSETISQAATALAANLEQNGYPAPSFAENGLTEYPKSPEIVGLRMQLLDAVTDLYRLALGPSDSSFLQPLFLNYEATVMDILNQFDFWAAVPLNGSATYAEIVARVNLPENLVRRVLKYAISIRFFAKDANSPDSIIHTSLSAFPAKKPLFQAWIRHHFQEGRPAAVHAAEAFRQFSSGKEKLSEEPLETGFALANIDRLEKPETYWEYLNRDIEGKSKGWRAAQFSQSMQAASAASVVHIEELLRLGYDWAKLGDATVIDIGGSSGHDALVLAENFPNLTFVVQDLPEVEDAFNERIPVEFRSRISFEPHDFFAPQKTEGQVYMLKTILHDWPDRYAAKVIANLLPHLESGSRLLLIETIAPSDTAGLPSATLGRMMNAFDTHMLHNLNALERDVKNWQSLLNLVDGRLEIAYVSQVPGALHQFIEIKIKA
ncbi:Sterigmatocystin 8-O-methyltransferase [Fusarium austroafricanum]|uniref:Sterigmatocystin 8-O-methyltransferase n=1 Tax=Fusarium austroafricanum TaxID=2364996 RepID=A0A8H4JX57_9HYPO|nr:Sterigmatocystin 8-O-methyltransferase [Fusarium austroafricanum]